MTAQQLSVRADRVDLRRGQLTRPRNGSLHAPLIIELDQRGFSRGLCTRVFEKPCAVIMIFGNCAVCGAGALLDFRELRAIEVGAVSGVLAAGSDVRRQSGAPLKSGATSAVLGVGGLFGFSGAFGLHALKPNRRTRKMSVAVLIV